MMSLEEVVKRILLFRTDLSRKDVLKRIEEKKRGVKGYLTDETAARIVATELGVEVPQEFFRPETLIKDVVSGLNDVTVTGRIITVHSPQTFTRSDMTKGTVAHLLITDKTGTMRVVLWNDKTNLIETGKLVEGEIIKVSHGYVREGIDGKLELHVGSRGEIQTSLTATKVKVADINEERGPITVEGVVATAPKTTQVTTARNEKVAVTSFDLEDNTGKIRVSVWRRLAENARNMGMGTRIRINNAYVKRGFADQLEVTSRRYTSIEIL